MRGHAKDLTVPEPDTEEFEFLARRLGYQTEVDQLQDKLEHVTETVLEMTRLLDQTQKRRKK